MPNSGIEPPREEDRVGDALFQHVADFRRAGLDIGPPELGHEARDGGLGGADLHAFDVFGHDDFLGARMEGAGIVDEGEAELDVLHLLVGVLAIPGVDGLRAALAVRHQERQLAGADDREAAGLIPCVDIGKVGDAVARHVVMVERLAELLEG